MEGGAVGLAACLPVRHSSLGTLRPHTRCLSRLLEGLSAGCPNDFCCQLGTRASCARLPLHLAALLPGLAGWRCCLQGLEVLHLISSCLSLLGNRDSKPLLYLSFSTCLIFLHRSLNTNLRKFASQNRESHRTSRYF